MTELTQEQKETRFAYVAGGSLCAMICVLTVMSIIPLFLGIALCLFVFGSTLAITLWRLEIP